MNVRQARPFVGVVLLLVLGWIGWLLMHVHRHEAVETAQETATDKKDLPAKDSDETGCSDGFVLDWSGDHLEAGRACKQLDGSSLLQGGVLIRMRDELGKEEVTVRSDQGVLPVEKDAPIELSGKVEVETPGPEPLEMEGTSLSILKAQKLVRSLQPVKFTQGEVSGHAGTLEHEWEARVTRLAGDPIVTIQGGRTNGRLVTLRGEKMERRDVQHSVHLSGQGQIDFGDGRVEGQQVDVQLSDDGQQVRRVEALGLARTTTTLAPGDTGGPAMERVLEAQRIVHEFEDASRLSAVEAQGSASLVGHATGGAGPTEKLLGDDVRLDFAAGQPPRLSGVKARGAPASFERQDSLGRHAASGSDLAVTIGAGGGLEKLDVNGTARLDDEAPTGTKHLDASRAELTFTPDGQSLHEIDFEGGPARLDETRADGGALRTVVARKGHLVLDGDGMPVGGHLDGDVELDDPASHARGDKAEFAGPPRKTTLTGHASVEQAGKTSHGDQIVRDEGLGTLVVHGTQHTIVRDVQGLPGMEAAATSDDPVYISSDDLTVDEKARRARYSGGRPSLRRGDTELTSDEMILDDQAGTLDATGTVESRLRLVKPEGAKQDPGALFDPTRVVHGTSKEFHYRRDTATVTYGGDAKLEQEGASLSADRIDVELEPGSSRVKTLTADGSAFFTSPDREAEGRRIVYLAADGSVRVEGGRRPARAKDSKGQFVSGGVVAFGADGTMRVISPAAGRTRGSAPVTAPPPAGS